jgi:serine protease Do
MEALAMHTKPQHWAISLCLASFMLAAPSQARVLTTFSDIAERAIPGVVNIRTTAYIQGRESSVDPYQFFLKGRVPRTSTSNALGSGVILDREGYIATNYHVIEGADVIEVLFAKSKKQVRAKVVGSDIKTDLALLKVESKSELTPLDLGDSDSLRVGDVVLAIGNPFGFAHTVTSGIISARGRVIGTGPFDDFLQTDAPIHPGNSGGPLIDVRGRVIGINSAVSSEGAGIGFAIPINMAKDVFKDLKAHGKVIRPWMGVVGKNILNSDEVGDAYDPTGVYGVIVTNLIVDGPAQASGIKMGDLIMGLGKEKVADLNHLQRLLSKSRPSEKVSIRLYRRTKGFINVSVKLSEIPVAKDLPQERDLF